MRAHRNSSTFRPAAICAILTCATLAACAAGTPASAPAAAQPRTYPTGEAAGAVWREAQTAVGLAAPLKITPSSPAVRAGQEVHFTIDVPHAGFLNVVTINIEGESAVLFPNSNHPDNHVQPGQLVVPSPDMGFAIQAQPPFGASLVLAYLTADRVDAAQGARSAAANQLPAYTAAGQDAIASAATKNFVVVPVNAAAPSASGPPAAGSTPPVAPLTAGMTTVLACPATGPCDPVPAPVKGQVERIAGTLLPGIFLDPPEQQVEAKGTVRPLTPKGLLLTKQSEGFVPKLYLDVADNCTIAYGHLVRPSGCDISDWLTFGGRITEPRGSDLLLQDMRRAQAAVQTLVTANLSDGQYAALCDFTFNAGTKAFRTSTLLKVINAGRPAEAPFQFMRWTKAGGKESKGLKNRRQREVALFLEGSAKEFAKALQLAPRDDELLDIRQGEASR